ncbi:MAG TPA: beta-ketoacyl-ACP synthase II [Spirochaetia bacterium]|nr:beta-ketoacyl-ACP synthase II [Spirochaetia bacterium]
MERRIVVTGMGTVNPLGNNVADFWKAVSAGENGVGKLTRFDTEGYSSKIAGEVKDFIPEKILESKEARRMDRFTQFAMVSALEAMKSAGLEVGKTDPERFGVVLGNGIGGIETLESQCRRIFEKGPKSVHPLFVPMMIANEAPGNIAIRFKAFGPCRCIVTACASSNDAIGDAWRLIRDGNADVMLAGGTEAPLTGLGFSGFCSLQAVSTRNDEPEKASRPFDRDRDGFVMAEGAGVLVLEELEHAKKRGARILAELAGYGATCDANHLTAPHPEGRGAIKAMQIALDAAGLAPTDIDYVNAHGTSTPINDPIETRAIKALFGDHAKKLKVSSTKSMTGHLLGAAGGIEAIVTIMAIQEQFFPPTRNLENPDPECDLDYVPNKGYKGRIRAAISNALGFGGHNSIVLFKEFAA